MGIQVTLQRHRGRCLHIAAVCEELFCPNKLLNHEMILHICKTKGQGEWVAFSPTAPLCSLPQALGPEVDCGSAMG